MKFTPEVIAALQILRDHAENDFERHRLDVLECDLTAPPVVEIIDDTHQRFNGIICRKIKSGHYTGDFRIHRAVYEYYCGNIPEGCDIHHIDRDKANNNPSNLQCLTKAEHRKLHNEQDKTTLNCLHCGKAFDVKTRFDNSGYCSTTCRVAHLYRLERNQTVHVCKRCGKEFVAYKYSSAQFCSDACRYADVQTVKKICPVCGKEFESPTWHDYQCCSHSCGSKLMWQTKRADDRAKTKPCEICGKEFIVQRKTQRFCSKSCAMKYRNRKI